jgi:hypothetical protein
MVTGAWLMTHVQANTPDWQLWLWMFVFGAGVGPSLAALTVIVQNSVKPEQLGVGTGTLVFMRQIGGSVGLAVAGTVFATEFTQKLPQALNAQGVPAAVSQQILATGGRVQGVGNLLPALQAVLPANLRYLAPAIVQGIHDAFALAVGDLFWASVVAASIALVGLLLLHDRKLHHHEEIAVSA